MIYFTICPSFHGSTLFSLLLNNHSEIFALGDTNPTREYDQTCACGEKVSTCEFWEYIKQRIDYNPDDPLTHLLPQYAPLSPYEKANKVFNSTLAVSANEIGQKAWDVGREPADRYLETYNKFYKACQSWFPHKAFIDGEKSLLKYMILASMGIPAKGVFHISRDPRAYALSYRKYKEDLPAKQVAFDWSAQHARIRKYTALFNKVPVHFLRYEDLAEKPQETMNKVFSFMGLEAEDVVKAPVEPKKHHLMGNKMLQEFDGTVSKDETWKEALSKEDQKEIAKAAGSLFKTFGYKT